jgi:O-antigen/teichoic acid export membrane protein
MKVGSTISEIRNLGGKVILVKGILGGVWGVVLIIILRLARPEVYLLYILLFTITEFWLDSIFGTLLGMIILEDRALIASGLLLLSRFFRLATLLAVWLVNELTIANILSIRLLTTAVIFSVAWLIARPNPKDFNRASILKVFKQSISFNTSELLNLIFINIDVNILVWRGAPTKLIANYAIIISLINALITLPSGIANILLPSLIRTYLQLKTKFYQKTRILYFAFIVLGGILWFTAAVLIKPVLNFFLKSNYAESISILIALSPLLGLRTLNHANINYLISIGWQSKRLIPQFIALIIKIGFGVYTFSKYQEQGMIMIAILAEILLTTGYFYRIIRHYFNEKKVDVL